MAYTAGNWVQLAGVPDEKLREIAVSYLKDNYASAGYSEENHSDAWKLIHEESADGESRTPSARMARIEEMRAEALKAKDADEEDINKSSDLAIAYWGMRKELIDERKKADGLVESGSTLKPYILPSLSLRMEKSSVSYSNNAESTIPAGEWRSLADSSFKKHQDEATAARRAAMSPLDAAIDEAPADKQGKIRELINTSLDVSKKAEVTDATTTLVRLHSDLKMKDKQAGKWFGDSDADHAIRTVKRAQKIVAERGTDTDVFTKPSTQPAADPNRVPLPGSSSTYYGQAVSIKPEDARKTARVAISSILLPDANGDSVGLDRVRIEAILDKIPVKEQYSNAELRNLYDQAAAATDPNERYAITAALGVLTLENHFAELRAQDKKWNMFANNESVVDFVKKAAANAAGYEVNDYTVGAAPADGATVGQRSVAIPPAPSGPDNEPYGPYRGQTYAASNTPRGTVREAQLLLEALGSEYSTGAGNSRRFGAGQQDASAMDGIVGEMTDAAIRKFQGENNLEVTGALDEATITNLREVVAARAAAAGRGQTGNGAGTTTTTDPKAELATIISGLKDDSGSPLSGADLNVFTTKEFIEKAAKELKVEESKVAGFVSNPLTSGMIVEKTKEETIKKISKQLTDAGVEADVVTRIASTIDVSQQGQIKSSFIQAVEAFTGRADANNVFDAVDAALLEDPKAIGLIAGAIKSGQITI